MDTTGWAATMCDLKDFRDLKEVHFLAKLFADVDADRLPQAMDMLAMRIREIRMAKVAGGSWEKAGAVSLMLSTVTVTTALPDGCVAL